MFAAGIVSMPISVAAPSFTPDGATVYFGRTQGSVRRIFASHRTDAGWSEPAAVPFPGPWTYLEPAVAPDGSYMIFASNRPADSSSPPLDGFWSGQARPGRGGNLWRVERGGDGWSEPRRLPDIVNTGTSVFAPAVARDGTLYFMRPENGGKFRLFRASFRDGAFAAPQPLPFSMEGISDVDPAIAPDDSYLIFCSERDTPGTLALYIAFRRDGAWRAPIRLPDRINAGGAIIEPRLSPDEKRLYFTRAGAIWSVDFADVVRDLRARSDREP
jgi:Tol biopolymer transport system component